MQNICFLLFYCFIFANTIKFKIITKKNTMENKIKYSEQLPDMSPLKDGVNAPEYLKWIEGFDPFKHDVSDFISVIIQNWGHGCGEIELQECHITVKLITCGLKENEEVIEALKRNQFFFDMFWQSLTRSGSNVFRIPKRFY